MLAKAWENFNKNSPKKTYRWLTNTLKDAQHHSLSEKCESKPQWGTISRQSEWLQSKSLQAINAGKGVEERNPLTLLVGMQTSTAAMENSVAAAAAAAKLLQSCPTLCNPIDGSPPGSTIPGILQARTLEWVAISFSNAWKWKVKVKLLSCVRLPATPWTAAHQAPPSMGVSRQEYWSGVPLPSPDLVS